MTTPIQELLNKAHSYRERLDKSPDLSLEAFANELGTDRVRLMQILNLLKLSPYIQRRLQNLPPEKAQRLTEHKLRRLNNKNPQTQKAEFERLLASD